MPRSNGWINAFDIDYRVALDMSPLICTIKSTSGSNHLFEKLWEVCWALWRFFFFISRFEGRM